MKELIASNTARLIKIEDKLTVVGEQLAVYNAHLGEHMRRTELAEKGLEKLNESLRPIQKHVTYIEGVLKFLGLIALGISITVGILKIVELST